MKKDELTKLATLYGAHECITHWAVSYRFLGKGDFFARLMQGGDCKTATYQRVLKIFSDQWPSDLEWPLPQRRSPDQSLKYLQDLKPLLAAGEAA